MQFYYLNIFDHKHEIVIAILTVFISTLATLALGKFILPFFKKNYKWSFYGKKIEINLSKRLFFYFTNQVILCLGIFIAQFFIFSYGILVFLSKINLLLLLIKAYQAVVKPSLLGKLINIMIIVPVAFNLFGLDEITIFNLDNYGITVGNFNFSLLFLVKAIYLVLCLSLLARLISNILQHYVQSHTEWNFNTREILIKISNLILYITLFLIGTNILGINLTALTVFSGAFGVGIGLSLQKISANFFSGLILLIEKNITVGNTIESAGGLKGRVKYLGARSIVLDDFNGGEVIIPNDELINSKVKRWKNGESNALITINITVSIENDPSTIMHLLLESTTTYPSSKTFPKPVALIMSYKEAAVEYRLEFWAKTKNTDLVKSQTLYKVWELFDKNKIKYL